MALTHGYCPIICFSIESRCVTHKSNRMDDYICNCHFRIFQCCTNSNYLSVKVFIIYLILYYVSFWKGNFNYLDRKKPGRRYLLRINNTETCLMHCKGDCQLTVWITSVASETGWSVFKLDQPSSMVHCGMKKGSKFETLVDEFLPTDG